MQLWIWQDFRKTKVVVTVTDTYTFGSQLLSKTFDSFDFAYGVGMTHVMMMPMG